MKNQQYITLFSNASNNLFKDNKPDNFRVQLARPVVLGFKDGWEVALTELACPPQKVGTVSKIDIIGETPVVIYCNLIEPQFLGNSLVRCLRTFIHPRTYCVLRFDNPYYLRVEQRSFQIIHIVMLNSDGTRMKLPDRAKVA